MFVDRRQQIVNEADSLFTPTGFPFRRRPPAVPHDFWFLGYYMKAYCLKNNTLISKPIGFHIVANKP